MTGIRRALMLSAPLVVVAASTAIQLAAIASHPLFATLGAPGVSGWRFAIAAAILLIIVRPRLRGRSVREWAGIVSFGMAMAAMNVSLYLAIERLPLGLAIAIDFLGPFAVAVMGIRRPVMAALPAAGLVGVLLIVGPAWLMDGMGLLFASASAVAFGAYTLLTERVGTAHRGFDSFALAVTVSAVALSPFAVESAPRLTADAVPALVVSGLLGVVIAFGLDLVAVRLIGARTVAVLFSFDPVLACLLGVLFFGEHLSLAALIGIGLVSLAGAAATVLANPRSTPTRKDDRHDRAPRLGRARSHTAVVHRPHAGLDLRGRPRRFAARRLDR
ncbi:DMT family transporter [Microbacterium aoyamense]|uniref:DMT family transporter n=1 Tax=Microbacterium aoyamense TaxID=344166 RepID=A0ABN2PB24_9MICO|nr:EamA family transporter [Microbacterium aoyamense]